MTSTIPLPKKLVLIVVDGMTPEAFEPARLVAEAVVLERVGASA